MSRIGEIKKLSDTRFLNFYEFEAVHRDGMSAPYFVASRAKKIEQLKAVSHENKPDGVVLFGVYGERKDRVVLVRQYRYPLGDYVYEFPAGLVESGEDTAAAGIREMYEETGLTFTPVDAGACSRPFFTTIGMTDESCGTVFGYCSGDPTSAHQESSEDIQVILADRAECKRILREENVAIMCAYMLMHFIADEGDPLAFCRKNKGGFPNGRQHSSDAPRGYRREGFRTLEKLAGNLHRPDAGSIYRPSDVGKMSGECPPPAGKHPRHPAERKDRGFQLLRYRRFRCR